MGHAPDFEGRTVLVTGAGGRPSAGTGPAIAQGFARAGARVAALDRAVQPLTDTVEAITTEGGTAIPIVADLANPADILRSVDEAEAAFGSIDILVNHAGIGSFATATESSEEEWDRVLAINLTAPFLLSKRVLPSMVDKGRGVIVNTLSIAGHSGGRAGIAYTATKHAMVGFTRSIAVSYGPAGIRCVGVAPGTVQADPHSPRDWASSPPQNSWLAGWSERAAATKIRVGGPTEVANAHLFLASDLAGYVNGTVLTVDGGWTAT